jgi:hypothetical protein
MARADPMLERIEAFNRGRGGGVRRTANGYSLYGTVETLGVSS